MALSTALVAAPLALLIAGLGLEISRRRIRNRVGLMRPGDEAFIRVQRVHGNAVEHVPLVLLLLLLWELGGAPGPWVLSLGSLFVTARAFHAAGLLLRLRHPLHFIGAALTYLLELLLAVLLVWQHLG